MKRTTDRIRAGAARRRRAGRPGGLMAKWLFTDASPANSGWPFPPLGIHIEPTVLSAGRACSAFVLLLAVLAVGRRKDLVIGRRDLPFFAVFGVAGLAMVHFTYFKTISLTNVATAILLEYLAPVIVLVVGVVFLRHKFTWALPAGVALSVAGMRAGGRRVRRGAGRIPRGDLWGLALGGVLRRVLAHGNVRCDAATARTRRSCGDLGSRRCSGSSCSGPAAVVWRVRRYPDGRARCCSWRW